MKLLLTLLLVLSTQAATAATYYRDRYLPTGAPCMIEFDGRSINAVMIADVKLGTYREIVELNFFSDNEYKSYEALRVTMVNGGFYQVTKGNLEHAKFGLLEQIKACK